MLRRFIVFMVGLLACMSAVHAGEAGRIVFVIGNATIANHPIALGDVVSEGAELITGADGYVYLKTIDEGFFILRPGSRARIVAYHIDTQEPANTRVKLELLHGVARTISGAGVKQSRQNFRFNTPVAAIGVRGTDFTVFTDQDVSRVAVISGGVVVSGFAGACHPEGSGPCEGATSRELSANQVSQLLQIRKGQAAPQILPSQGTSPDLTAPPRSDEPNTKGATLNNPTLPTGEASLDAQKSANLLSLNTPIPSPPPPPLSLPSPPLAPEKPAEPSRQIIWGRWQAVLGQAPGVDIAKVVDAKGKILAINPYFVLMQSAGADWQAPSQGTVGFALKQSDAYVLDEPTHLLTSVKLENAQLQVDFAKASFSTSFDLINQQERFKFQAKGDVGKNGQLYGANQFIGPTNMTVTGIIGPENGLSAAYLFQGRIDARRLATGGTYWSK